MLEIIQSHFYNVISTRKEPFVLAWISYKASPLQARSRSSDTTTTDLLVLADSEYPALAALPNIWQMTQKTTNYNYLFFENFFADFF
jgi:hypothetical protein